MTIIELSGKTEEHFANTNNPHKLKKITVLGLDNVDNVADANKPVNSKLQTELDKKISISDIYNDLSESTSIDLTKVPLSATQGKVLAESISAMTNIDQTIGALDKRISALEGTAN